MQREKGELARYAIEGLVVELIPILDNFERAMEVEVDSAGAECLMAGVQMIYSQVQNALEMLATAQRELAIAQTRYESDTDRTRDLDRATITKEAEARGRTIRDDDPRGGRRQRRSWDEELGRDEQDDPPPRIDIVI